MAPKLVRNIKNKTSGALSCEGQGWNCCEKTLIREDATKDETVNAVAFLPITVKNVAGLTWYKVQDFCYVLLKRRFSDCPSYLGHMVCARVLTFIV